MGEVYQAKRIDGEFEQQVAIKIIRPGYLSDQINLKFQTERQILARLNHPNIARVIDGGRFDGERLYLAMEYVEGIPIDVYCQQNKLSRAQKLKLFAKICSAVSSAHQNRIIHCDIKPTNILVSENGEPHLLDFGIATFIDNQANNEENKHDTSNINAITWDYASPEQQAGLCLTTATDIYALGILLYELLLEKRPSINEQSKIVEQLTDLADLDLQMIITKALQFDPVQRYSSLDKLTSDVQCQLNRRPISLRLNERKYLFTRFLQRNKAVSAVTCLTIVLLVSFSYREYQLRVYAQLAQVKAEHESKKSQQVISFLTNIFKISDPDQAKGNRVTAREILDKGRDNISKDLKNQPAVHTELLLTIANVYENLGLYKDAGKIYQQGLKLATVKLPNNLPLQLSFINRLSFVNIELSLYLEVEQLLKKALTYELPEYHSSFGSTFNHLGLLRHEQGEAKQAIAYFTTALEIRKQSNTTKPSDIFRIQHNLARSYVKVGQYQRAEGLLGQVLIDKQQVYGKRHQSYIRSLTSYVALAQYQGVKKETMALGREALSLAQEVLEENHPDVINGLSLMANLLHEVGDYKQAENYYKQLLDLEAKYNGKNTVSYSVGINNLASLYKDMQNYEKAEPLFRQSLALREKLYKSDNPRIANALANLGQLFNLTGRYDKAMVLNQQALTILQNNSNQSTYRISKAQMKLAQSYLGKNNGKKSTDILQQVKVLLTQNVKPQSSLFANLYFYQAKLDASQGNITQAIDLIKQTIKIQTKVLNTKHPLLAEYRVQLAEWLVQKKQWGRAKRLIEDNLPSLNHYLYHNAPILLKANTLLKRIEAELAFDEPA
jgi:serine/threonine protein kinase